jgi:SagB-type dehydrogenase family enzyme
MKLIFVLTISLIPNILFAEIIKLPKPQLKGKISIEEAIYNRRSIRSYKKEPLTLNEVSQLLWASGGVTCDGITGATRAYPSAGASYPLEIYLVVGNVTGLEPGVYRYLWKEHSLELKIPGDKRTQLTSASWFQGMIKNAPVSIVFTAIYGRTTGRYGKRGENYVCMDLGHAGQNVHLQAESLGLGTVVIGAFQDDSVKGVLNLPKNEVPLYIMPVGRKE